MYVFVCICACVRFVYTRRKSSWRCKRRKHCWVCTWKLAIIIVIKGERRSRRRPLNINLATAPQRARAGRKLNTHTHTHRHTIAVLLFLNRQFSAPRSANTRSPSSSTSLSSQFFAQIFNAFFSTPFLVVIVSFSGCVRASVYFVTYSSHLLCVISHKLNKKINVFHGNARTKDKHKINVAKIKGRMHETKLKLQLLLLW